TVEQYRKTGKFPDGATLVKEIRKLESGELVTGHPVVWGSSPVRWFVMVKDAKGRFDGNPLWAKGWGWALFNADDPKTNVAKSYEADCKNCHIAAEKSDRVFIQGYPTLGSE
ncbi:MAG: cytochrome P460 family protein, partial [Syntrophaceae bacterium]|nr:cytochrome P460 family protein [Syntrophaceae bacterium]